ncbi:hypothetical protein HID58_078254 [Brassica napus]|uniref:Uncharacterized protein n=1 Tax=Brassica napus TaxID=3708 RepID=A0ABQ7YSQ0_BRANA|nr:hypothetical protein HID58_078254 [Brassica napus]
MIRRVKYFEIQPESHRPTSMNEDMLGGSKAPPMAKQNATSGTLASREFYKESSQPSNALKKTTVVQQIMVSVSRYITMEALEQSLRDINGGRDINEIISEVDGEKFSKKGSFATSSSLCQIYRNVCFVPFKAAPLRLLGVISNFIHFTHGMLTIGKAFSFQLKLGDFNFTFQLKLGEFNVTSKHQTFTVSRIITEHERDAHGPDDNGDVAKLAKDVAPPNGESVKKKARQE